MSAPLRFALGLACLGLLVACSALPNLPLGGASGAASASPASVSVVVAVRDLAIGVPVTAEDVALRELPGSAVDRDHTFTTPADVIGRVPRRRVLADEPVRAERLGPGTPEQGLSSSIPAGPVALTLPLSDVAGHSGLLRAGGYVDIAFVPDPARTRDPSADGARVIIQAVKLLAVDHSQDLPEKYGKEARQYGAQTVTVQLSDAEVATLLVARAAGRIQVSERSGTDILLLDAAPVTLEALRAGQ